MVKLRVRSCFQQVPPTKFPYVILPSSDGQEPVYATAYDGTGNLNIFYVCKDVFTAIRIFRFYRSAPSMQWTREDTTFQVNGTSGQTDDAPNSLTYLGALYHKSRNLIYDPTRPNVALAPLLVGIGRTSRFTKAPGNLSPHVVDAQEVVWLPNNQYGDDQPASLCTVLFRDQLSHINFDDVQLGAADNALWVETAIQDLSGAGDGSSIKGTNWRAHVFAIFQNVADPAILRLMHTQSFDPSGAGGSGVVELEPGIFE
ncbi:hypothetical protein NEMBOFW57_008147 [Staphylotrichum longicolle]|uniref:Uncharacterized protein n=1 Tax=Staphylotrichum longicolle TaxID=669026 RepID=A0AAD4EQU4_9PEZI|nr:hypothetical protein NEMBOFW57_008147 [Staphylotrichum longicolle]